MDIKEYQKKAHTFADYECPQVECGNGVVRVLNYTYPILEVAEESGELVGKIAKALRDEKGFVSPDKKQSIILEIGDVLWGLAELCTCLNVDFEDCFRQNISKLESRKERDKIHGSGDYR